jgi:hypothetical protein
VGVTHIISICSYTGFFNESLQYHWLSEYLATSINRTKTPWVIAMMHVPFYNSNTGHYMEGELQRIQMEPFLYDIGVDIVIAGHVHVYERTYPVYNNELDPCGATHFTLGDGGNYEGTYTTWFEAPAWSAFRESSFGVTELEIFNDTHASYAWHRHACYNYTESFPNPALGADFIDTCVSKVFKIFYCVYYDFNRIRIYLFCSIQKGDNSAQKMETSDVFWIVKPTKEKCPNRWKSTATFTTQTSDVEPVVNPQASSSCNDNTFKFNAANISLIALCAVFFASNFVSFWLGKVVNNSSKTGNRNLNFEKIKNEEMRNPFMNDDA